MSATFHRFLFVIKPVDAALPVIAAERRSHALDRPVRDDHAYVTMEILDDQDQRPGRLVDALCAIGAAVDVPAFAVALSRVVGTTRSVALRPDRPAAGLSALHSALRRGVERAGLMSRQGWNFSPHLTIGYRDAPAFSRAIAPILWPVDELVLIHSFVGETRHEVVGCWRLGSDRQLSLF